jgi:hypothetical protein
LPRPFRMLARAPGDALACDACTTQNVPSEKGVHPIQPRPKRLCSQLRRKRKLCPEGFARSERKTCREPLTPGDRPPPGRCSNWYTKDRRYRPRTAKRGTALHQSPNTAGQLRSHSRQNAPQPGRARASPGRHDDRETTRLRPGQPFRGCPGLRLGVRALQVPETPDLPGARTLLGSYSLRPGHRGRGQLAPLARARPLAGQARGQRPQAQDVSVLPRIPE